MDTITNTNTNTNTNTITTKHLMKTELKPFQRDTVDKMLAFESSYDGGLLLNSTGTGKSLCAINMIITSNTKTLIVCGGGVKNIALMELLKIQGRNKLPMIKIESSSQFGIDPQLVESLAFAWLAWAFMQKRPANLPAVTGSKAPRILGALYPA